MEQEALVFLGAFAFAGVLFKLVILFNLSAKSKIAESFVVVCILFLIQNVSEFLAYFTYLPSEQVSRVFFHAYMISLYFIFPAVLILALTLVEYKHLRRAQIALYSISSLLTLAHFGGFVIAGVKFLGWTAISIQADYFWLASAFVMLSAISAIAVLVYHFLMNDSFEIRGRCKVNLLAFSPMFVIIIFVIISRFLGFESSLAVSLPLASMFFLLIMLLQSNGDIFWVSLRLKIILSVMTLKNINSLDEILLRIERVRIIEALRVCNGVQRSAAKLLSTPPSTLNKKIAKHNIIAEEFQGISVAQAFKIRRAV